MFVLKEKCLLRKGIVKYTKANDIIALCKHVDVSHPSLFAVREVQVAILEINNHICQLAKKCPRPTRAAITFSLGSNNHPYKKNDEVHAAFCIVGESLSKIQNSKFKKEVILGNLNC